MGGQGDPLADSQSDVCGGDGDESAKFLPGQPDRCGFRGELAECLRRGGQDERCTRVRLGGLLLLMIDFVCRNHSVGGFAVAADPADGFEKNIHPTPPAAAKSALG